MKYWREIVVVIALILAGVSAKAWLDQHDAALLAKAERQRLITERDQAKNREEQAVGEIEKLKREVRDPQVIVKEIPKYLPFRVEPEPQPRGNSDGTLAPPQITVAGPELPKLWDFVQDCRECQVKLAARNQEVTNLEAQIHSLEKLKNRPWYKSPKLWFTVGAITGGAIGAAAQ